MSGKPNSAVPASSHRIRSMILWQGITVEILFRPPWMPLYEELYGYPLVHLEIRVVEPKGAILPISSTGYRSHFTRLDNIEAYGGVDGYVTAWLDHEASSPHWSPIADKPLRVH
jgi:hypothetical protein